MKNKVNSINNNSSNFINPSIFRSYDIRGIYPTEINEKTSYKVGKGIATLFINSFKKENEKEGDIKIALGHDMRLSSPTLKKSIKKALVESGITVVDIGLASTPTLYFSVLHFNYDGGIQISASHNPKDYNGFKIVKRVPVGLIKIGKNTGMEELKDIVLSEKFIETGKKGKVIKNKAVLKKEVEKLLKVGIEKGNKIKNIKIVADPGNAAGALYLEELFKKLPCRLIKMNFKLDGTFPSHQPDPMKFETLKDLQKKVKDERADLGVAPDGDGDRVFFIDEKGKVIPASHITALLAKEFLNKFPGEKIAFDVRYSKTVKGVIIENKGIPVITKVGHALITEAMERENAIFGGESSGHYFFKETGFAESALMVIIMVLNIISREDKPISKILKPLVKSIESGEINFELKEREEVEKKINLLKEKYKDGKISILDGLSIEYPKWRFNLRASNTEPLLRLNLEAENQEILKEKKKELTNLLC